MTEERFIWIFIFLFLNCPLYALRVKQKLVSVPHLKIVNLFNLLLYDRE